MAGKSFTGLLTACFLAMALPYASLQAAANTGLEAARHELRLRSETERRMREEFEALLANGRMTAAEIADFESYLAHLGTMVDEQHRVVAKLQGTGAESTTSPAAPLPDDFDRGQTDAEKIAMLDAELGSSLSEFDEKLLREQKEIAEKSRATSTGGGADGDGAQGSGGASGEGAEGEEDRQADGGADGESASNGGESATGSSGEDGESGQQAGVGQKGDTSGEGAGGDHQVASAGGGNDARRQTSTPPDIPDGKDDDIVARQLREAAENEQDPELREKLWEEYRKYKQRAR